MSGVGGEDDTPSGRAVFHACSDASDAVPLCAAQALYLKPQARLHVSVQLPSLKTLGKSISNWELMEKIRQFAEPDEFINLKVSKTTLEVVRFEGEIENKSKIPAVLARLDGRSIKISGFRESLKIRAAEAKPDFPAKHSWDSYFRDAKNMNEMKPGERPDTLHITNLPCKWFTNKSDLSRPSEYVLRRVFQVFGEVRCVDIPMLDPFRSQMKSHISGMKMFSNNQNNLIFEAYIQFKDYVCFVKCMDALRGMNLLHKNSSGKTFTAIIKVNFDRSKHLSESMIRKRRVERERLMAKEREREQQERQLHEENEKKLAEERRRAAEEQATREERQRLREDRRKARQLTRLRQREVDAINNKIATEERLLLVAQRRQHTMRLLEELIKRLETAKKKERERYFNEEDYRKKREKQKNEKLGNSAPTLEVKEKELRDKLVKKFKRTEKNENIKKKLEPSDDRNVEDDSEFHDHNNIDGQRYYQRGNQRGRKNWQRRGRRGMGGFRGGSFPPLPFQPYTHPRGFFPHRGFSHWPRYPPRGRGGGGGDAGYMPPFIDPYYLEAALQDPYYRYFNKLAFGDKKSRSRSRSRSRSYSRSSRSYSSYSRSRSRSRSYTRSRSRSKSRSRHRRSPSHRSRRRTQTRSKSRSHSRGRSSRRSRSRKERSRDRSRSTRNSKTVIEKTAEARQLENSTINEEQTTEKAPTVHTWSRSPSRERSLSWEKRMDEPSSSTSKPEKSKKKKKEKKEKKKKKSKFE